MNGEQVKPRTFKEKWEQIKHEYLKDLKPKDVQDYNEMVMLGLLGERLVDLINEEAEKTRKLMDGLGLINGEMMDHAEVLKDELEKLRADETTTPPETEETDAGDQE